MPVLDPGRGCTKTGQLWAYAADDRPWGGAERISQSSRQPNHRSLTRFYASVNIGTRWKTNGVSVII